MKHPCALGTKSSLRALIYLFIILLIPVSVYSEALPVNETTAEDQINIALSIYNSNLALVRETREADLPSGISMLRFMDISAQIKPASVNARSLNSEAGIHFLEQGYEYDLITPQNLMDRYVGCKVKLIDRDKETGEDRVLDAELISNNQGPVYLIGGEIHIGHPGRVVLSKIPEGLVNRPALVWKINAQDAGKHPVEVSYLTGGVDWDADYTILLNPEETRGDISAWVTIKNNTGISYKNAAVQLIAGDIGRAGEQRMIRMKKADARGALSEDLPEEAISEYHLYNLPGDMILKDNQTKQVSLFNAERVPIKKELRYYGNERFYGQRYTNIERSQRVGVYLELENKRMYNLGVPFPEGTVRVYKKDSEARVQFLGEDMIRHVPEDEKVKIRMGYSFDLVAERKQTDWRKISSDIIELTWEITIRNQKTETAWIVVMEPVPGDWEIMESSHQWEKDDARTLVFNISVAPKAEEKIRYRARIIF
ncbi:DUF4139 domain-containing protein [bacterium]|nr:DUF4139 domain-containing protein [bacterium]